MRIEQFGTVAEFACRSVLGISDSIYILIAQSVHSIFKKVIDLVDESGKMLKYTQRYSVTHR